MEDSRSRSPCRPHRPTHGGRVRRRGQRDRAHRAVRRPCRRPRPSRRRDPPPCHRQIRPSAHRRYGERSLGEDWGWLADDLAARIENAPENTVVLVAEARTEVVCAAWLVFKDGVDFGGLWGGSTLKEWRGQGIYRAMVAHRAQLAAVRDVPYVYVDASADSAPILTRLGLHAVTTTTPYVWSP